MLRRHDRRERRCEEGARIRPVGPAKRSTLPGAQLGVPLWKLPLATYRLPSGPKTMPCVVLSPR